MGYDYIDLFKIRTSDYGEQTSGYIIWGKILCSWAAGDLSRRAQRYRVS
jgi:hypothetical protein